MCADKYLHSHRFQLSRAQRLRAKPKCSLRDPGLLVGAQWGLVLSWPVEAGPSLQGTSENVKTKPPPLAYISVTGAVCGYTRVLQMGIWSGFCNTSCFCTPPCICVHQSLTCQKVIPSVCSASLPSCHARCSRCSRSGQKPYASTWGEHDSKVTLEMQLGTSLGAWSVHPWGHCWLGRNIKTIEQGTVPLALQDPTPVVQGFSKTFSS